MVQPFEVSEQLNAANNIRPESFLSSARESAYKRTDEPGKTQDKPKTEAEKAKEDAEKLIKTLLKDAKDGKWSEESTKGWKRVVDEQKGLPGATPDAVAEALNEIGAAINKSMEKQGSKNRVGMAVQEDVKTGETKYYMILNGPTIKKADNVKAILDDKDSETVIKVGSMASKKKE